MKFRTLALLITLVLKNCEGSPEVSIHEGKLIGSHDNDRNGRQYSQFLGVPYGHIPKRFDISVPVASWNGTKMAQDYSPGCPRLGAISSGYAGVEDCLTLDVYTSKLPSLGESLDLLPVMLWITGGAFVDGASSMYGGKYFLENDIVLVNINYRLGSFGFLNAGTKNARGNQGLKDMVLALQWVQRNIDAFSGDKNSVTIFGESAGGAAVSLLTLSPMAKGLFHRAIIQSVSGNCPYIFGTGTGIMAAKKLAAAVDCPSNNNEYLVECLMKIEAQKLAKLTVYFNEYGIDSHGIQMSPTFETFTPNDGNVFITDDPYTLADSGAFHKVPIIVGMLSNEYRGKAKFLVSNRKTVKKINTQFGRIFPNALVYQETAEDPAITTQKIRQYYFNNSEINENSVDNMDAMLNDRYFIHCVRMMASAFAKHTQVYAFNYTKPEFGREVKFGPKSAKIGHYASENKNNTDPIEGTPPGHGDEVQYLFETLPPLNLIYPNKICKDSRDYRFSRNFVSLWYSFAKDGIPGKWGDQNITWTPLEAGKRQQYLQLNNEPFMANVTDEFMASMNFWESLQLKESGRSWE